MRFDVWCLSLMPTVYTATAPASRSVWPSASSCPGLFLLALSIFSLSRGVLGGVGRVAATLQLVSGLRPGTMRPGHSPASRPSTTLPGVVLNGA